MISKVNSFSPGFKGYAVNYNGNKKISPGGNTSTLEDIEALQNLTERIEKASTRDIKYDYSQGEGFSLNLNDNGKLTSVSLINSKCIDGDVSVIQIDERLSKKPLYTLFIEKSPKIDAEIKDLTTVLASKTHVSEGAITDILA